MATRGWLATVTRVGCQKFVGGVIGGGSRRLANDDHGRWYLKDGRQTFQTLEINTPGLKNSNDVLVILILILILN